MTVAELELVENLRLSGRAPVAVEARVCGELGESDLALLASERGSRPRPIAKLRDRHHALARCLAQGMRDSEAALITGYDPSRISILKGDPTFRKLVEDYKDIKAEAFADFHERASTLAVSAVNELQDRLEEVPESFQNEDLLEIMKATADRTGHAPVSKSVAIHANVDLGQRLNAARERLRKADPKVIEATKEAAE